MKLCTFRIKVLVFLSLLLMPLTAIQAQEMEQEEELAKELANPIADLVSVPFQYNYDENIGPAEEGKRHRLNIQPVIPFHINEDWTLITRTIVPLIDLEDIPFEGDSESGLGDILASQFFSPKHPTPRGWTWGVGPVWLFPTATEDILGSEQWAIGPTGVALNQVGPWTYGLLANHLWSYAGDDDRASINATFLQPFISYVTETHTTISITSESTYDWNDENWAVPVNLVLAQLLKVGNLPFQVGVGARYWAESPDNGPEDWGGRAVVTFLFPK